MAQTRPPGPTAVMPHHPRLLYPALGLKKELSVSADSAAGCQLCACLVLPASLYLTASVHLLSLLLCPLNVSWEANSGVGQDKAEAQRSL